jgi:hypothetical protein
MSIRIAKKIWNFCISCMLLGTAAAAAVRVQWSGTVSRDALLFINSFRLIAE